MILMIVQTAMDSKTREQRDAEFAQINLEEVAKIWAKPTKTDLARFPKLGETDGKSNATTIVEGHFFVGGCDWFVTEFDGEDTFFGFAILNGDYQMAEWGYISYESLKEIKVGGFAEVDFDKHWDKRQVQDVEKIKLGGGVYK